MFGDLVRTRVFFLRCGLVNRAWFLSQWREFIRKLAIKRLKKRNDERIEWLEQVNYASFFSVDGGISNGP